MKRPRLHLGASGVEACEEAVRLMTALAAESGSRSADLRFCLRILPSASLSSAAFSCAQSQRIMQI